MQRPLRLYPWLSLSRNQNFPLHPRRLSRRRRSSQLRSPAPASAGVSKLINLKPDGSVYAQVSFSARSVGHRRTDLVAAARLRLSRVAESPRTSDHVADVANV